MPWKPKGDGALDPTSFFMHQHFQIVKRHPTSAQEASTTSHKVHGEGVELKVWDNKGATLMEHASALSADASAEDMTDSENKPQRAGDDLHRDDFDERPRAKRRVGEQAFLCQTQSSKRGEDLQQPHAVQRTADEDNETDFIRVTIQGHRGGSVHGQRQGVLRPAGPRSSTRDVEGGKAFLRQTQRSTSWGEDLQQPHVSKESPVRTTIPTSSRSPYKDIEVEASTTEEQESYGLQDPELQQDMLKGHPEDKLRAET